MKPIFNQYVVIIMLLLLSSCARISYEQRSFRDRMRNRNFKVVFKADGTAYLYPFKHRVQTFPSLTH